MVRSFVKPASGSLGVIHAAEGFLTALTPERRARAVFEFEAEERFRWHYAPITRNGLPRGEMEAAEVEAADALVAASVCERVRRKARDIIELEPILGVIERTNLGRPAFNRDPGLYYHSVFSEPGDGTVWGWRLDGHHLSMHFTISEGHLASSTPSFLGANPAEVPFGPRRGQRTLKEEEDLARDLFVSLDDSQTRLALIYPVAAPEILTRASRRFDLGAPVGLPADLMSAGQREKLMRLIGVYLERTTAEFRTETLKGIEDSGIGEIHFAWAGSKHRGEGHYYRVHGPGFLAEYDNTPDMANHVHSIWRNPGGDWGEDTLKTHYERHHT